MVRTISIVGQVATNARRAILVTLACAAVAVGGLFASYEHDRRQSTAASARLVAAQAATERVNGLTGQLDLLASLAAATGDQSWISAYDTAVARLDQAVLDAAAFADPAVSQAFKVETGLSRRKLLALDTAIMGHIRKGEATEAKRLLDDPVYQYHRTVLKDGTGRFAARIAAGVKRDLVSTHRRSLAVVAGFILITSIAAFFLWRFLMHNLSKTEDMHAAAENKMTHLAHSDVLTGLANRIAFREGLSEAIERAAAAGTKLAVLMIDLDRFKPINDRHGHLVGDIVLKEVAERLRGVERKGTLRARFGGDEFVCVVEYETDDQIPLKVAARLIESLTAPIPCHGLVLDIGASIGVALYPSDATDDETLINKADMALYRAKGEGRGTVRRFDASMGDAIKAAATLESELASAIKSRAIAPYFQPIVDLSTRRVTGFEVLARWHHETRGMLPPSEFIRVAEKANLIDDLGLALLQRACADVRSLPPHITISINLSLRQIQDERIAHRILAILSKTKFPPSRLEVDIAETAVINDLEAATAVIGALKSIGVKVALDDFGTGFSSLTYLSALPFDRIKIDRSLIHALHARQESARIVGAIIGVGRSLGIPTVAEGIESERDAETLRGMGCPLGQGFHYAKAGPAADLADMFGKLSRAEAATATAAAVA